MAREFDGFPGNDEILRLWERSLHTLELQRAQYGSPDVPVHILNSIEYVKGEIRHLRQDPNDTSGLSRPVVVQLAVLQEQMRQLAREVHSLGSDGRVGRVERRLYHLTVLMLFVIGGVSTTMVAWLVNAAGLLR